MEKACLKALLVRLKNLHLERVEVDLCWVKMKKVEARTWFMCLFERQTKRVGTHY